MGFLQDGPQLPHPLRADRLLQHLLSHALSAERRAAALPDLEALGDYALMAWKRHLHTPRETPVHTPWGAWGQRVDRVRLTETWYEGNAMTTRHGVLATGHDTDIGSTARLEQFMRVYLYHVASEFFTCPLAMTDGAVTAIKASGNRELIERALPRFLSRDADALWLSGQWMTETAGGSDVSHTETRAERDASGQWRLYGRKWFTSAIIGEAALALARPVDGADDLALFYVETRDADGAWNGVTIDRLKDKLGNREVPTAEIHLDGVPAWPLGELSHGVRQISPMLNVTRTWNAICAVASSARCLALATDYARRRKVFGRALIEQPLHVRTLADMQAEHAGAFALAFQVAGMLGRVERGEAADAEPALLRLLTPLAKLWTAKVSVSIASETLECFGGNGYIEDTGLPQLLRDAQVYPIWEGTTNVLSLDVLRVLARTGLQPLRTGIDAWLADVPAHAPAVGVIEHALDATQAIVEAGAAEPDRLACGARGIALTLARIAAAALLARNAARAPDDGFMQAALDVFVDHGLLRLDDTGHMEAMQQLVAPARSAS
ncbi:MAG TPA: acyl-CoA dehydrogenase family protein [Oleiagrimonas sp.]|nr:acyl-CoA dehydrogenase family protein [Oleiagrimonas sp.]